MPEHPVAVPRPASTVAILRDGSTGLDVWLMRRRDTMAFAGGMRAFPGGAVEAGDHDPSLPWSDGSPTGLAAVLGSTADVARALVSAAVRETFEECGALYARRTDGGTVASDLEARRLALLDGSLPWAGFLAAESLALDASALVAWSRWITPDWSPRRFDAYFFVAAAPAGAGPRWIDGEADRADWASVRDAVAAHERGDLPMLLPTIETLRSLAKHDRVADVLASAPAAVTTEDG